MRFSVDHSGNGGVIRIEKVQVDCKTFKPTGLSYVILDKTNGKWSLGDKRFSGRDDWQDHNYVGCWKVVITKTDKKIETKPFEIKDRRVGKCGEDRDRDDNRGGLLSWLVRR